MSSPSLTDRNSPTLSLALSMPSSDSDMLVTVGGSSISMVTGVNETETAV